jgi:hypothetical protein
LKARVSALNGVPLVFTQQIVEQPDDDVLLHDGELVT